ncbi:MAG: hypothetical protein QXT73_00710 [Candidatus Methanomethylicaceae archaeon]
MSRIRIGIVLFAGCLLAGCMSVAATPSVPQAWLQLPAEVQKLPPKKDLRVQVYDEDYLLVPVEDMEWLAGWVMECERRHELLLLHWRRLQQLLEPFVVKER